MAAAGFQKMKRSAPTRPAMKTITPSPPDVVLHFQFSTDPQYRLRLGVEAQSYREYQLASLAGQSRYRSSAPVGYERLPLRDRSHRPFLSLRNLLKR